MSNPVADLFRIEKSRDWREVLTSVHRLRHIIAPAELSLRKAFETWLLKVILPRFGLKPEEFPITLSLEEIETMLAENIDRWNREIREQGLEEGREQGRQEGEARLVLRQLQLKFGSLSAEVEDRVRSADAERLLVWGERVLTAESLADILRD